jgi:hypothetical protein
MIILVYGVIKTQEIAGEVLLKSNLLVDRIALALLILTMIIVPRLVLVALVKLRQKIHLISIPKKEMTSGRIALLLSLVVGLPDPNLRLNQLENLGQVIMRIREEDLAMRRYQLWIMLIIIPKISLKMII